MPKRPSKEKDIPGVVQVDENLNSKIVPWYKASSYGEPGVRIGEHANKLDTRILGTMEFDPLPPIKKRTPQERLDSLMARITLQLERVGPEGLGTSVLAELATLINGVTGRDITGEDIRALAAYHLNKAQREENIKNAGLIVRPSPSD